MEYFLIGVSLWGFLVFIFGGFFAQDKKYKKDVQIFFFWAALIAVIVLAISQNGI